MDAAEAVAADAGAGGEAGGDDDADTSKAAVRFQSVARGRQARKRVAAGSFGKLVRKVLNAVPGFKAPGAGRFFYPVRGFGQVSEAYAADAQRLGADMRLGWRQKRIEVAAREVGSGRGPAIGAWGTGGVEVGGKGIY